MPGNIIYKISNIWKYWNTRKMSSDEAMLAIGKLMPEYVLNGTKKPKAKPVVEIKNTEGKEEWP